MKPLSFIAGHKSRLLLLAAIATGVLGMQAGRGTLAFFTTSFTSTGNVFTAGTLKMNISDVDQANQATTVASSITFTGKMAPGDIVYAPIEIDNTGTLPGLLGIKYATTTTGLDLAPGLTLAIKEASGGTGTIGTTSGSPLTACDSTNFGTAGVWATTVQAATAMTAGAGPTVVVAPAVGLPMIATTGHAILCLQVTFAEPGVGNNTYNDAVNDHTNTTITFTFDGRSSATPVIVNP